MGTVAGGGDGCCAFPVLSSIPSAPSFARPDGGTIRLRPKTLEILRLLAGNAGRVLSKQQLMEAAWPNVHVGEDSLFQCIREIRTALGDDKRQVVRVISGRGYLFQAEVTEVQVTEAGVTEVATPAAPEIAPVSQPEPAAPDTTATSKRTANPRNAFSTSAGVASRLRFRRGARHPVHGGRRVDVAPRSDLCARAHDHRRDAYRGREQRSRSPPRWPRRQRPSDRWAGEDRKYPRAGSGSRPQRRPTSW